MSYYDKNIRYALETLSSNAGLNDNEVNLSRVKFGENIIKKGKKKSFLKRLVEALFQPMVLILLISVCITLGLNIGEFIRTGQADFMEAIGIIFAVVLSTGVTLVMEGNSQKAFESLSRSKNLSAKVMRNGKIILIKESELVVGDICFLSPGDKILADGRLISDESLFVDESALTGESVAVRKNSEKVLDINTCLADRVNSVYSGTFVTGGFAKFVVVAVGKNTEIGKIAGEIEKKKEILTPLEEKLSSLSKTITLIGTAISVGVFLISMVKLLVTKNFNFNSVQNSFVSAIVLIVACVPEGLPTIVAVSLALNMTKLAKQNALIKKLVATETTGAVSVICTDKTGTLTENKMRVVKICTDRMCEIPEKFRLEVLYENFCINSTAELKFDNLNNPEFIGSATEGALLLAFKNATGGRYSRIRSMAKVVRVTPFSSENKVMETVVEKSNFFRKFVKGAPEKVINQCDLTEKEVDSICKKIAKSSLSGGRVLCFAHADSISGDFNDTKLVFDAFVVISDKLKKQVVSAVKSAKKAGISVVMLTGDNLNTAIAIAKEAGILEGEKLAVNAEYIDKLTDTELSEKIKNIAVIARSAPITKLRVVKALKLVGEVVAVTGDGVNDAPAIKQADVGISMGITGSEITKEASDIVLLDDGFDTIIKAVAFGRTVYSNLKKFIFFQLSVNASALIFTVVAVLFGFQTPFSTLQLLWINLIMDGPPALTLGLEKPDSLVLDRPPVKRSSPLVDKFTLIKILLTGAFISSVCLLQYAFNFLCVDKSEILASVFTLFVSFQLFNAFNARSVGKKSVFSGIKENKIMPITFGATFLLHLIIVTVFPSVFKINALSLVSVIKTVLLAFSIIVLFSVIKLLKNINKKRNLA